MAKKKEDEAKRKEAIEKVNELLKDTSFGNVKTETETEVFVAPVEDNGFLQPAANDQAITWLNEQVTALTAQAENDKRLIHQLRTENQNLVNIINTGANGGQVTNNGALENKLIEVFKHFESVYTGRKFGQPYDTVKFSNPQHGNGVLDVLLAAFPQLQNVREYRHKG